MRDKNDYFSNGDPIQRESYCAFLDVLGFSDQIMASYKSSTPDLLLQRFHSILKRNITRIESDTEDSMLYFNSLTDNIIIAHPGFSEDMESEFGFILWAIREFQYDMALEGFFVRGGLSLGNLFIDRHTVYGDALINAYQLESQASINPIVTLCDKTMERVDSHIKFYAGEDAPQKIDILINQDNRYFINYLSESIDDTGVQIKVNFHDLRKHKTRIEHALSLHRSKPAIFAKFSWLSQYHNFFCASVRTYPGYSDDVLIPDAAYALEIRRL